MLLPSLISPIARVNDDRSWVDLPRIGRGARSIYSRHKISVHNLIPLTSIPAEEASLLVIVVSYIISYFEYASLKDTVRIFLQTAPLSQN